jgi:hypothetical protein
MTDQRNLLINFVPAEPGQWGVSGIGDTSLPVLGQGDVQITSVVNGKSMQGLMRGVLLVSGLGTNLYSIGTATAAGIEVLFTKDTVSFTRNGLVLIEGKRAEKTLYHLNIQAIDRLPKTETALRATKLLPLSTWHKRFGHVNNKTLLRMASLGCTNGFAVFNDDLSTVCEGCILGKMQRLSFKHGHEKATAPGQRIHSDVCGPIHVVTPGGNRYFVTFKDDFSSYCTTKLLKKKSEVAVALQNFVTTVKNQKREGVRCIRTDNGGEYLQRILTNLRQTFVFISFKVTDKCLS